MARMQAAKVIHLSRLATVEDSDSAEKRRALRRRVLKGAIAAHNDRHCTVSCTVRDISATGARLRSDGTVNIPDTFELLIELDGLEADCEVVWRKGNELGVRFVGAPKRVAPKRVQAVNTPKPGAPNLLRKKPRDLNGA